MSKKVFIGVGHGGSDPGAVANGFKEKDINLTIATACADVLKRHGVDVLMSRTRDENDSLEEEIRECNAFAPDLAIDDHNNAGGGDGFEAWYQAESEESKRLAEHIEREVKAIGQNSRGVKKRLNSYGSDYYGFLREVKGCPAVILESAFVDNAADMQIIDTEAEQKVMGIAQAKGVLSYLGIPYKEETPTAKPSTSSGSATASVGVGSVVRLKEGAKSYTGETLASFVYKRDHIVSSLKGDRAVITYGGVVVAAVRVSDLTVAGKQTAKPAAKKIEAGSKVRVKEGARTYTGAWLASFVYDRVHVVKELKGDRAVITYGGVVVAAMKVSDLSLV